MRTFLPAAAAGLALLSVPAHAQQPQAPPRQPPKVVRSDPVLTLPSGARAYVAGSEYPPVGHGAGSEGPGTTAGGGGSASPQGGMIQLKPKQASEAEEPAPAEPEPTDEPAGWGAYFPLNFGGLLHQPRDDDPVVDAGSAPDDATADATANDATNEAEEEREVDLAHVGSLTGHSLEVDLGDSLLGTISFVRDEAYDLLHPHGNPDGNLDDAGSSAGGRRKKRQRLRRIQSLAGDSICNLDPTLDPELCSQTVPLEPGVDYTPNNPYLLPTRFEYFEGTGYSLLNGTLVQSTIYIKKLPSANGGEYLSGFMNTPTMEYTFRGDPNDGKTYVRASDPESVPTMPPPIEPGLDGEEEEVYDEYDGTGLPLAPLVGEDGRRRLRKQVRRVHGAMEGENEFGGQIQGQVERYLEGAKVRNRRLQDDGGEVVDILVAYTKGALCELNSALSSCATFDTINPDNHQAAINKADEAVAATNQAYINSNLNLQLRLVYVQYVEDVDETTCDCVCMIYALKNAGDGIADGVHAKRNEWGADMVALLTSSRMSGCGGIAFVGHASPYYSYAHVMFSVTIAAYATGGVFAHEVGHNFGCQHDRANAPTSSPYEYGWQDPLGRFRTTLAYRYPCRYNGPCPRINYFSSSDPAVTYDGIPVGNALNDCARKHREVQAKVALYRKVRLTEAPTKSLTPSASVAPSEEPTGDPTISPTKSRSPSLEPSVSIAPSGMPSDWPTFGNGELENYARLDSPGTTVFHLGHGIMFDVTAKERDVTIHNFAIPFGKGGDMKITVWTREGGGFWYEKNNKDAWTWRGTPDAYSPGITLEDPVALAWRGSEDGGYFGIDPIQIPAGTTKGIYIVVNATGENNFIGTYNTAGSLCAADYVEPHDFQTWFENSDFAVSEGIYKNNFPDVGWTKSYGTALESYRFLGSVYYESTPVSGRKRTLAEVSAPAPSPSRRFLQEKEAPVRVDEAILNDILEQYTAHEPSQCNTQAQADATTFTFDFPGTNTNSGWNEDFVGYEEDLFQAMMSHTDANGKSWDLRIGTGGNIYSLYAKDKWGETFPPQNHDNAPWIDEVQQMVAVNGDVNRNNDWRNGGTPDYPQYCTTGTAGDETPGDGSPTDGEIPIVVGLDGEPIAGDGDTTCAQYFHHQAGAYQGDSPKTDTPFFSPSLAKHCEGNTCTFASWGTQAHVPTPFTSPIIYVNRYTNCGDGVIEHTQVIHNFAPVGSDATGAQGTDQTYFNVGWGGVKSSTLPYALEAFADTDSFDYTNPDSTAYLPSCPWGDDGEDNESAARGQRKSISETPGYTTFVQEGLQINRDVPQIRTWCRDPNGCSEATIAECMKPCTDERITAEWTPIELEIPPGGPNCEYHDGREGKVSLSCNLRSATGFGQTEPYAYSPDPCAPWTRIAFARSDDTSVVLEVFFVRHWSWDLADKKVYFSIFLEDDGQGASGPRALEGVNMVNNLFSNDGVDPITINLVSTGSPLGTSAPVGYSPGSLDAFTYVYGRGEDYADPNKEIGGSGRRRLGSTSQGEGSRDYTVFTNNWLGGRLSASETYTNRGSLFLSSLSEVKATADTLRDQVVIDKVQLEDWSPRAVSIYSDESAFTVVPALAAQDDTAPCSGASATKGCSGFSTPQSNHAPFFLVTCGTSKYIGPDPYYFTPDFGASFPEHGSYDNPVRSYVCSNDANARPEWKLLGFFNEGSGGCDAASMTAMASLAFKEDMCDGTQVPSSSPSVSVMPSVSLMPSNHPSVSTGPSMSLAPSPEVLEEVGSPPSVDYDAVDGIMFDVTAKTENLFIRNFELIVFSVDPLLAREPTEVTVYTTPGSFYNTTDGKDPSAWTDRGTFMVAPSPSLGVPTLLPRDSFQPIFVHQAESVGIYITIKDPLRKRKLFARLGTALLADDVEDSHVLVKEGLGKQWSPCLGWGGTLADTNLNPQPYKLAGSVLYKLVGTSLPTSRPSLQPSFVPSVSANPSVSSAPSDQPSVSGAPSMTPSSKPSEADMKASAIPSAVPSITPMPTHELVEMPTPGIADQQDEEGSDADGVMFDLEASKACEVYSITFGRMNKFPMNIQVYSRLGSHYYAYDDASQWELIQSYTNYTYDDDEDPRRVSFPPQYIAAGETRAFYIAIVETYGEIRPLSNGLLIGNNYLRGVWAQDDRLTMKEGLKFFGISEDKPFGEGTESSGVFDLQGPGGRSYNMKNAIVRYRPIDTIAPSISPSISQVPSTSQIPSTQPTTSEEPSLSPSISLNPTPKPTGEPSVSMKPSQYPSDSPSLEPSISFSPSEGPSVSSRPSSMPSEQPSSIPSMLPSESPSISTEPSSMPSMLPSESPSVSQSPSFMPSISLVPTMERHVLDSTGATDGGAYGVMMDIIPNRALTVETFHVMQFGGSNSFTFHIYTKSGSWSSAPSNGGAWTKIGQHTMTTNDAMVKIPHSAIEPVTVFQGQTQSFYIASTGHYFAVNSEPQSSAATNGEVSLYTGQRKFPTNELFGSGAPWYRFRGKMLYSYAIDPPSSAPSSVPTSFPSKSPSGYPSSIPSEQPSYVPSASAAPSPSSDMPSDSPSNSQVPSYAPSQLPSNSPISPPSTTPSLSFAPTKTKARIQITIPSVITVSGFELPQTELQIQTIISIVAPTIAATVRLDLRDDQRLKEVIITSINGVAVEAGTETFFRRRLVNILDVDIEYKIVLEEICATEFCYDAQDVANELYDSVTEAMQREIDSGTFELELEKTAEEIGVELDAAIENSDFSALVVTVLALLSSWYPTWTHGQYCENDGGQPTYMRLNPDEWMYGSRDGCCSRYYSYDYAACMGVNDERVGFYPAWDSDTSKCLNDTNAPDYMRNDAAAWLYEDVEGCCERYYGYDFDNCIALSWGNTTASYTNKWYINHIDLRCDQDCPASDSDSCGGAVDSWKDLFDSALDCCENRLSWVAPHVCETRSTGATTTGTFKWWVDWVQERCVQDCASSSSSTCGGIVHDAHVDMYDTADACCSDKLDWVPGALCQSASTNTPIAPAGSNGWYVDHRKGMKGLCVQDCEGSSPCGGLAQNWDKVYSSAGECCSEKLWWVERSKCTPN